MTRLALLIIGAGVLGACGATQPDQNAPTEIPPNAFAVVGTQALSNSLLAGDDATSRGDYAGKLVRDELFRQEAKDLAPFRSQAAERGVLARRLMEDVERKVRAESPITSEEIEQAYKREWLKFDRPRSVRSVQVLFGVSPPEDDEAQRLRAERLHAAVQGTHNLREFDAAAQQAFPDGSAKQYARTFEMPPMAADGRIVPLQPQDFAVAGISETLAKAVSALKSPGDISAVVYSKLGYHIFFATAVYPSKQIALSEARDEIERTLLAARVEESLNPIVDSPAVPVVRRRDDVTQLLSALMNEK